jgi:serine/threonine protein phosphatase PrpC
MIICGATKQDGTPCSLPAKGPSRYCWAHDPANREQRRRMASRAARSNRRNQPTRELQDVKHRLIDLADAVLEGRADRGSAAVAGQLLNTAIRALEVERKWHETDELEAHIAELEGYAQERSGRGQPWRA